MPTPKPCGRRFCPAATRIVWAETSWTTGQAAAAIAVRPAQLWRQGIEYLDLPERPCKTRAKRVSAAAIRAAWSRDDVPLETLAADLAMHPDTLRRLAQTIGGAKRRKCGRKHRMKPCRWFTEMWDFNVSIREMAAHMGCATSQVCYLAARLGLTPRSKGPSRYHRKPGLDDFFRDELPRIQLQRAAIFDEAARVIHDSAGEALSATGKGKIIRLMKACGKDIRFPKSPRTKPDSALPSQTNRISLIALQSEIPT